MIWVASVSWIEISWILSLLLTIVIAFFYPGVGVEPSDYLIWTIESISISFTEPNYFVSLLPYLNPPANLPVPGSFSIVPESCVGFP